MWFIISQNARIKQAFIENAIIQQEFDEIAQAFYVIMIYFWDKRLENRASLTIKQPDHEKTFPFYSHFTDGVSINTGPMPACRRPYFR